MPVTIKVESSLEHSVTVDYTTPGVWQELKFDFSSYTSTTNKKISVFFDIQVNGDVVTDPNLNIFQIDDFIFGQFSTLKVQEFEIEGLKAYPNPTNDLWKISTKDQEIQAISVFNVLGKRVIYLNPNTMSVDIDASGFPSGIYLTTITTQKGTSSRKLIKN
ncbi:Por secretion system C-terminal sorting domain-containing protein [Lutibacter agarilyticus]|uniref:Por secretion system C-terminal sorting domain-containing protein n=1 Tax=Lutibacter agarilyticus TaxID=1109740 RepID=A0A238V872_9FLAO|nr:T9SS type A sorting domain-containing protein [Lutibacter agarilyticus]SNR30615.1 Por secretion system C-terminal sorting domain-containing protein [Lutibacter agarilyticus]